VSLGAALERAAILAYGSDGKKHRRRCRGVYEIPIKETRSWSSSTLGYEHREEAALAHAKLTNEERAVLELLEEPVGQPELQTQTIRAGDLVRFLRRGYTLVAGTTREQDGATLLDVEGLERHQRSYQAIGERLGLTEFQVQRRVLSARRKLRSAGAR
jgi:hypothetical protein